MESNNLVVEECSQFTGRLYDLCTGCGREGRPFPELRKSNAWRLKRGLSPLEESVCEESHAEIEGPGTEFKRILAEYGIVSTGLCSCVALQARMNSLGSIGCREELDELCTAVRSNASLTTLYQLMTSEMTISKLIQGVISLMSFDPVRSLLTLAIERSEQKYGATKRKIRIRQLSNQPIPHSRGCCSHSKSSSTSKPSTNVEQVVWAYGVTTVPERLNTTLPKTLYSLKQAGFTSPHLFIDGRASLEEYSKFNLPITLRTARLRVVGTWITALWELYIRYPNSRFYAIFQDDIVLSRNARGFIEKVFPSTKAYLNLYNVPENESKRPQGIIYGSYPSNQRGRGALGLVFTLEAVHGLLHSNHLLHKPKDLERGWKNIDGAVLESMKNLGFQEYVTWPSVIQHTGHRSTIGTPTRELPVSFRGEEFDLLSLGELK